MKNFKEWLDGVKWLWEFNRMCDDMELNSKWVALTEARIVVENAVSILVWSKNYWLCVMVGHKWVETGWAGPDSGWMGVDCTRCGKSYHTTLY